jgi:hypothetical protein
LEFDKVLGGVAVSLEALQLFGLAFDEFAQFVVFLFGLVVEL